MLILGSCESIPSTFASELKSDDADELNVPRFLGFFGVFVLKPEVCLVKNNPPSLWFDV
jgi:hypothetical protein